MDTYGMHGIHGRGPALATGLAAAREDLSIWVVTGDGDALSIGGNHLIHTLRRNVPVKILLFNNRIYGLTKGQASPTSERGKVTKSSPGGTLEAPVDAVSLALGANATFVARTHDRDKKHLTQVLRAAAEHPGTALVEVLQNCPVFNDKTFEHVPDNRIDLVPGQPIAGVTRDETGRLTTGDGPPVIHDATNAAHAFELAQLGDLSAGPVPLGVFRQVDVPPWGEALVSALRDAHQTLGDADL